MQIQAEVDPFDPAVLQICCQLHTIVEPLDDLMSKSNKGMATTVEDSSTIIDKTQTKEGMYSLAPLNASSDSTSLMINVLENFMAKDAVQLLPHAALRSIQEFDGSDKVATIPWLDQVELVAERMGNNPVEVGISKLKGLALGDINKIRKEQGLTWHKFGQILIENYSNIPYMSDVIKGYMQLTQQDDKSTHNI